MCVRESIIGTYGFQGRSLSAAELVSEEAFPKAQSYHGLYLIHFSRDCLVQSSTVRGALSSMPLELLVRGTRISALPKGLISWFLGHQYPRGTPVGDRSRIHQIPPYRLRGCHQVRRPPRSSRTSVVIEPLLTRSLPWEGKSRLGFGSRTARCSMRGTGNLNDTSAKTNRQEKNPHRYVFTENFPRVKVAPKPSDEGSLSRLRNPFLRDRVVRWNRQRNYHVHPYWTDNLKYVA
jgi:hypothetical protein